MVRENLEKRLSGEMDSINYSFRGIKLSGEVIHIEVYGSRTDYRDRPAVIGTILDTTKRVEKPRANYRCNSTDSRRSITLQWQWRGPNTRSRRNWPCWSAVAVSCLRPMCHLLPCPTELETMPVRAQSGFRRKSIGQLAYGSPRKASGRKSFTQIRR